MAKPAPTTKKVGKVIQKEGAPKAAAARAQVDESDDDNTSNVSKLMAAMEKSATKEY